MRADSRFSHVFVLGHSEGAMHALLSANRGARIDGVILASGTGRRLGAVLHDQFRQYVDSSSVAQIDAAWERLMRGEEPGAYPPIAKPVFGSPYRKMLRSMGEYDPASEMRRAAVPVLVIQGGMDWQVTMDDATSLRKAKPDAAWLLIPQANHVFKAADAATPSSQQSQYTDKGLPLVPELAPGIVEFVKARSGSGLRR